MAARASRLHMTTSMTEISTTTEAPTLDQTYVRGKVLKVESANTDTEFGEPIVTQQIRIKITTGNEIGKEMVVEYQVRGSGASERTLHEGQPVVVSRTAIPGGEITYAITEPLRLPVIGWTLAGFFVLTILFAGRRGLMAFVGLAVTAAIIAWYVVPQITTGANPFVVSLVATAAIACTSLFLAHGFNRRTAVAFVSILITIVLAIGLTEWVVAAAHLTGLGSEESYYLQFAPTATINLRGLLLGGIIIGVLGVLDDVATAQTAAVAELKAANKSFAWRELYRRGSVVGREHITSLVNTLVLAYVGASFPLLLLFSAYSTPWWVTLNTELLTEEVVRTLVGSMALVAAVPITTALAAWVFTRYPET